MYCVSQQIAPNPAAMELCRINPSKFNVVFGLFLACRSLSPHLLRTLSNFVRFQWYETQSNTDITCWLSANSENTIIMWFLYKRMDARLGFRSTIVMYVCIVFRILFTYYVDEANINEFTKFRNFSISFFSTSEWIYTSTIWRKTNPNIETHTVTLTTQPSHERKKNKWYKHNV